MAGLEREIKRIRYPHMVREEVKIWKRFLVKYGKRYDRYDYDVHVGKGVGMIPGLSEPYRTMARTISKKRIDVIAYKRGDPYIIEIKDIADMQAIGQLNTYRALYEDKHGRGSVKGLLIVSLSTDHDIKRAAKEQSIRILEV